MKSFRLLVATTVALLAVSGVASAESVALKADLLPSSEVPPTPTTGHGALNGSFDTASKVLKWDITYEGLTGPASAAHFHGPAPAGTNAKVQVPIDKAALASPIKGQATLTDSQAKDLLAGNWYFNVHTAKNPGGEIRGQVTH